MRVTEFAKKNGLPAGIVLAQAKALALEVSSTLSALDAEDVASLDSWLKGLSAEARQALLDKYEASHKARKAKGDAERLQDAKTNRAAVEVHREKALEAAHLGKGTPKVKVAQAPKAEPKSQPEVAKAEPAPAEKPEQAAPVAEAKPAEEKPAPAPAPKAEKPEKPQVATKAPAPRPAQPVSAKPAPVAPAPSMPSASTKSTLAPKVNAEPPRPVLVGLSPTTPNKKNDRNANLRGNGRNAPAQRNDGRRNDRSGRKAPGAPAQTGSAHSATPPAVVLTGKKLQLNGPMTVKELAELMDVLPNKLIVDLMGLKVLATINQTLEPGLIQKIAEKYGFTTEVSERSKRSAERKPQLKSEDADDDIPEDKPEDMVLRPPVVTFLGHVDHGKTTLMDYIRKAHVAAGEAGGITQHIAAYTIQLDQTDDAGNKRLITFVDTPGHSAFESMRARGANITDIAVIIVAADDGVMPQTREAIKHARNAGVQMLVAVTKCDKPEANPMRVYQMLQAEGLTPSTWGGDIECCEVSGTTGQGVDDLLETILIQADVLELQANPNRRANGAVIESQLEQGLGPTATLLIQGGTLKVGDVVLCGEHYGKVRTLIDERGKQVKSAGPSIAVKCTGLSGVPEAGSEFRVMLNEKRARELAERTAEANKLQSLSAAQSSILSDWTKLLDSDGKAELDVIVKGDAQGTAEAVVECLKDIKSNKVSLKVLYSGVGSITSADIQRAKGATVLGFSVNCEPGVQAMARQNGVRVNTFRIIYELIEHVKRCMLDLIAPEYKEVVRGHAEVRQVFDISKLGKIAGCQMLDGSLKFKGKFRIYRGKTQIYDGAVVTMKHFKDDVKEIAPAQECGLGFGSFEGFQEGDIVECYEMEELPKTL